MNFIDKILQEATTKILNEKVLNFFQNDIALKKQYVDQVWDILQNSYASIGGIHGSGFTSKEDMIKNIPLWKIAKRGEKVVAVVMYKDKIGRKRIAAGMDGTDEGRHYWKQMGKDELNTLRSYGEISGAPLAIQLRNNPNLADLAFSIDQVKEVLPDDEFREPPSDDKEVQKFPQLKPFFYQRLIGGDWHTKIMIGKTNQPINRN